MKFSPHVWPTDVVDSLVEAAVWSPGDFFFFFFLHLSPIICTYTQNRHLPFSVTFKQNKVDVFYWVPIQQNEKQSSWWVTAVAHLTETPAVCWSRHLEEEEEQGDHQLHRDFSSSLKKTMKVCVCVWGGASLAQWEQQQQGGGGDLMCNVASWSVASCHFQSSTCDTWPGRSVAVSRLTSLQSSSSCVHIQTCVICIVFFKTGSVFSSCSLTEQSDRNRQRVTLFRGRIMRVIPGD